MPACPGSCEDWPIGTHFVELPTPQDMRRLLGPADESLRRRRSEVYFSGLPNPARARLPLGMHDRFEEYVFADGRLHAQDAAGHARHFPAHLKVVRLATFEIGAGQTWNASASHLDWSGVHFREELYLHVRVDRLIVAPGACLEVCGNVFVLECGSIEMQADRMERHTGESGGFEIRIRPTPHNAYSEKRLSPGATDVDGVDGLDGQQGQASQVIGTPFGPRVLNQSDDRHGRPGTDGTSGTNGATGANGGMLMLADIRIGTLKGFKPASLRIAAQAGNGEPGGRGGRGGHGGSGGHGADGVDGIDGLIPGGPGGGGGAGGHGGDGGRGGSGGLASNLFVQIPAAFAACIDPCSMDSIGGTGGAAGLGGTGGAGGRHGALPDGKTTAKAASGEAGRNGAAGNPGKPRAGPQIHIFTDSIPSITKPAPQACLGDTEAARHRPT